ncbi:RNA polymerase sigma factor [Chitinophaga sp. HK235]|uniref:RNA polymerase sigma factor n=1 Tax=Chitinophaga sp. HK235 TaxID=2952571 RepID=UPI001BAD76A8|nr:RNA polymerase sigma-70 factor [Chitinophaga sp. HK235]
MEYAIPNESVLISRVIEGDKDAFREIYDHYRAHIFAYAYHLTKSKETAHEIVQQVFIRLWLKREQINPALHFGGYIKKATLNHVLNFIRKTAREQQLQEKVYQRMEAMRNTTEEELVMKELQQVYRAAIDKLPPQKKLIYCLSRHDELTHEEIAQKLNISKYTVNNHLVEALRLVRQYVHAHADMAGFLVALLLREWL